MTHQPRILIVDDQPSARRTLELILNRSGYATVCAASGRDALEQAQKGDLDIALLDIRLPDMEGVDLLAPLKAQHPEIACIMVTGYASVETAVQALNDGAVGYITKPLDMDRVLGTIEGILEKQRLVRDKLQAEAALRESERRLWMVVSNAPVILFAMDGDGRVTFSTGRGLQTSPLSHQGWSVEQLNGHRPSDVCPELKPVEQHARDAMDRQATIAATETLGDATFEITYTPVLGSNGAVNGVVGVATDVTERVRLETELQQQRRLAAMGQLAGGIAHDFNNLLTTIILYANLLKDDQSLNADLAPIVGTIVEESYQASALVQQILDFSRNATMETQPLDLVESVHGLTDLLRRTLPENIRVHVAAASPSCHVQADPTRIQQVLMNLAVNARDAMPEGGDLRIELSRLSTTPDSPPPVANMPPGHWIRMTVADTGTGMTDEVKARIFEPFFTTKEQGKGTGLGLAQVYGIVKQHDGFIDVNTAPQAGTAFDIYFPERVSEVPQVQGEAAPALPHQGRGEVILLVEDQDNLREGGRQALTALGYNVLTATHGEEALEIIQSVSVHLIITDIVMPKMGGKALMQEIKRRPVNAPVLAMTGYTMEVDGQDLSNIGFCGVIHKPFDMATLSRVVQQTLDGRPQRASSPGVPTLAPEGAGGLQRQAGQD